MIHLCCTWSPCHQNFHQPSISFPLFHLPAFLFRYLTSWQHQAGGEGHWLHRHSFRCIMTLPWPLAVKPLRSPSPVSLKPLTLLLTPLLQPWYDQRLIFILNLLTDIANTKKQHLQRTLSSMSFICANVCTPCLHLSGDNSSVLQGSRTCREFPLPTGQICVQHYNLYHRNWPHVQPAQPHR